MKNFKLFIAWLAKQGPHRDDPVSDLAGNLRDAEFISRHTGRERAFQADTSSFRAFHELICGCRNGLKVTGDPDPHSALLQARKEFETLTEKKNAH